MTNAISGTAASIRAATDSETFDLAGHDAANIGQTIADAFSAPLPLERMIRLTFVVGAGKNSRQRYDDKAMQSLTLALRGLGYIEDRGASCVNECGGSYKTQHDTGRNLFTVVVFPKLEGPAGGDGGGEAPELSVSYPIALPLAEGSPEHAVLAASEGAFEKMVPSACPSWSEKRACSEVLRAALETAEMLDAKLVSGTPLSEKENEFYDEVGGAASIGTKAECLRGLMHQQVEGGPMTRGELDRLLRQVRERIESLDADIDAAESKSQGKRSAKLKAQREKAMSRKAMLEGRAAGPPHGLKHDAQIVKLTRQLRPLLKLEQDARGRLLSGKEARELAAKDELEGEISALEEASRGWFEDDEAFGARVAASRAKRDSAAKRSNKSSSAGRGKAPGTGSRSASSAAWLTPGGVAAKQAALGRRAAKKKSGSRSDGVGAFAAMMLDSDSD